MNIRKSKGFLLGAGLFFVEWVLFMGIAFLLGIESREAVLFSVIYFMVLFFFNHYKFLPELIWQEIVKMLKAHTLYWVLTMVIGVYLNDGFFVKITILTVIMYCVVILVGRTYRLCARKRYATQLLVLGAGKSAEDINDVFVHNRFMFINPLAFVDLQSLTGEEPTDEKSVHERMIPLEKLQGFLKENQVDEAFIVDENLSNDQLERLTGYLHHKVPVIKYKPAMKVVQPYNTEVSDYDGNLFISVTDARRRAIDVILKKIIDIAAGIVGCILLIPLTFVVKIASLMKGDRDPIFFTQDRIGKDGKIIKIYKYRSMVPNAEQVLEEMMEKDSKIREEYLTNKKLDPDPRVTPLGKFLRKSSLDEMPQFINILKGDMSLIGPRPYLPREIEDMGKHYETIVKSKPGLTGMWQANGRSDVKFPERCKLDVYYYDNWSIWLDVIIIVKTIKAVLKKDGAV